MSTGFQMRELKKSELQVNWVPNERAEGKHVFGLILSDVTQIWAIFDPHPPLPSVTKDFFWEFLFGLQFLFTM